MKPREVPLIELAKALCELLGVEEVSAVVTEVDARTETMRLTIKGRDINYEEVSKLLISNSCAVRSIDEIDVCKE